MAEKTRLESLYYTSQCRHFTGIHREVCELGIRYDTLRDYQPGYTMARWPCVKVSKEVAATACGKQSNYTAEESAVMVAEDDARIAKFLADLESGKCPHCGATVEEEAQVGSCVYAKPCGHRLGQGTAKKPSHP